ncbi:hypothetical protein C475_22359 [Halosimplex carlsbadense 2-9-1]|uniref:Uncharacterized protein n=1 Tax=Halosimplex carlsbadense 2-9-1 TaxID=797114 RepID=M0CAT1_9EURY|nr:hypothetical protein C475_22359 [Halosimplex carlsbadense 2-9-1]
MRESLIDLHIEVSSEFPGFLCEFRNLYSFFPFSWVTHIDLRKESFDSRFIIVISIQNFVNRFFGLVFLATFQVLLCDEKFMATVTEAFLFSVVFKFRKVVGCERNSLPNIQCALSASVDPILRPVDCVFEPIVVCDGA